MANKTKRLWSLILITFIAASAQALRITTHELKPLANTQGHDLAKTQGHDGAAAAFATKFATDVANDIGEVLRAKIKESVSSFINVVTGEITYFRNKVRPLIISVINDDEDDLTLSQMVFVNGKIFKHPPINEVIKKGQAHVFYLANVDGGWFTGVTGYFNYKCCNGQWVFGSAFAHPYSGALKARAEWGKVSWYDPKPNPGKSAYDKMDNTANMGIRRTDLGGIPELETLVTLVNYGE